MVESTHDRDSGGDILRALLGLRSRLLSYIRAIVRDLDLAEDIYQELCVTVVRRQDQIEATEYLERYFHEPASWPDYLALLGIDSILDASRRGRSIYND